MAAVVRQLATFSAYRLAAPPDGKGCYLPRQRAMRTYQGKRIVSHFIRITTMAEPKVYTITGGSYRGRRNLGAGYNVTAG